MGLKQQKTSRGAIWNATSTYASLNSTPKMLCDLLCGTLEPGVREARFAEAFAQLDENKQREYILQSANSLRDCFTDPSGEELYYPHLIEKDKRIEDTLRFVLSHYHPQGISSSAPGRAEVFNGSLNNVSRDGDIVLHYVRRNNKIKERIRPFELPLKKSTLEFGAPLQIVTLSLPEEGGLNDDFQTRKIIYGIGHNGEVYYDARRDNPLTLKNLGVSCNTFALADVYLKYNLQPLEER